VGTLRFLIKRFAAQRMLGLAVVVTLAFCIGVVVAGPVYADAAREAIFSSTVSTSAVTTANVRFQVFATAGLDYAAADEPVTSAARELPVDEVVRAGYADVHLLAPNGPDAPLIFRDGAVAHLPFEGDAPGAGEIALPDVTASVLHLGIGDRLVVAGTGGEARLTISGTYGRADPADPFWFGERSPFPDPESPDPIPVLVDRSVFLDLADELTLSPELTWDAYLGFEGMPFPQAEAIPSTLDRIGGELTQEPGLSSIRVLTGIGDVIEVVRQRVDNLRVPILLVVFQIGAVTLAVLAGVGSLALTRQSFELSVLHSRGFSRRTLLGAQAGQAVVAAAIAFPFGVGLAAALARVASRSNGPSLPGVLFPIRLSAGSLVLGAAVAALGAVVLTLLSIPHVGRTVLEQRHSITREDRPALVRLPVEVFVLPVAVFAFLQLRSGAAPEVGSGSIDPLVLLAPTLFIVAGSFLAIRMLLFAFRRLDAVIGRSRRLPVYLAGRRLARSPGMGSAVALLLLLSAGLLVVSSSYHATVLRNRSDVAHQQVGSDWQVQVAAPDRPLAVVARMPENTTPLARVDPSFAEPAAPGAAGAASAAAIGVDPATFADGAWWRDDAAPLPLEELLARLDTSHIGMPVPAASDLRISMDVPADAAGLHLQATTVAGNGTVTTTDAGRLPAGPSSATVSLHGAASLLSITFAEIDPLPHLPYTLSIRIGGLEVDGNGVDLASWQPVNWRGATGTLTPEGNGLRYALTLGSGEVVGGLEPGLPPLPAVLSPQMRTERGSSFTVTLGGQQLQVREVAEATRFPTLVHNQPFLVVSLPALLERAQAVPEAGLAIDEVWARGADDPSRELTAIGLAVGDVRSAAPIEASLAELPRSLAVGMHLTAAGGGLALVIVGVGVGLFFAQRRREYEFAALQAMGVEPSQIRRTLALEQLLLIGFAAAAALGIGYLMLRITMPYVSKSLGFSFPEPVLVLDWPLLGAALLAVTAATALALAAAVRAVSRASVTGVLRGEAE
jgi:hypothetical protein